MSYDFTELQASISALDLAVAPDEPLVERQQATALLALSKASFNMLAKFNLLPVVGGRRTYRYPERYLKDLVTFAGQHAVTVSIAWLFLLQCRYQQASCEQERVKLRRICHDLVAEGKLMTRQQVCTTLDISDGATFGRTKQGLLLAAMIGSRLFYLRTIVQRLSRPRQLKSAAEAAAWLDITQQQLDGYVANGFLAYTHDPTPHRHRRRYYRLEDLDNLAEQLILLELPGSIEVAAKLGVSRQSVRIWHNRGYIDATRCHGRLCFAWSEVERVQTQLQSYTINPQFAWLDTHLQQLRRPTRYLQVSRTLARLGFGERGAIVLKLWGDQGIVPFYLPNFPGHGQTNRHYVEPWITGICNQANGRPVTQAIAIEYRDRCQNSQPPRIR